MSNIAVQKIGPINAKSHTLLDEIAKRMEAVKQRAFELFQTRGQQDGRDMDDWLTAEHELFGWTPSELVEDPKQFEIRLALAGFDPKDVQITASPREIVVQARSESERREEKPNVLWSEFGSAALYRRYQLPASIDVDRTKADLDKGLLRIVAPKDGVRAINVAAA